MRQVEIRQTEIEGIASFVQGDSCVTEYFATHSKMGLMRTLLYRLRKHHNLKGKGISDYSTNNCTHNQMYGIWKIIPHKEYNSTHFHNDIALIRRDRLELYGFNM